MYYRQARRQNIHYGNNELPNSQESLQTEISTPETTLTYQRTISPSMETTQTTPMANYFRSNSSIMPTTAEQNHSYLYPSINDATYQDDEHEDIVLEDDILSNIETSNSTGYVRNVMSY